MPTASVMAAKKEGLPAEFSGFSPKTSTFLKGLAKNNKKAWFEEHRGEYEAYYVEPAKAFVMAIAPKLKKVSKTISAEPRINGSIFRINRDVRFSKDKTPYKAHLDMRFWDGEKGGWEAPGLFFRLTPTELILGAGLHRMEKGQLDAYRKAVLDPRKGKALVKVLGDLEREGFAIGAKTRKKVPRGFDADHERA